MPPRTVLSQNIQLLQHLFFTQKSPYPPLQFFSFFLKKLFLLNTLLKCLCLYVSLFLCRSMPPTASLKRNIQFLQHLIFTQKSPYPPLRFLSFFMKKLFLLNTLLKYFCLYVSLFSCRSMPPTTSLKQNIQFLQHLFFTQKSPYPPYDFNHSSW